MKKRKTVSIDPQLLAKAKRRAAEDGISFSAYVCRLVLRDSQQVKETDAMVALREEMEEKIAKIEAAFLGQGKPPKS